MFRWNLQLCTRWSVYFREDSISSNRLMLLFQTVLGYSLCTLYFGPVVSAIKVNVHWTQFWSIWPCVYVDRWMQCRCLSNNRYIPMLTHREQFFPLYRDHSLGRVRHSPLIAAGVLQESELILKLRAKGVCNSYGWAKTRSSAIAKRPAPPWFKIIKK